MIDPRLIRVANDPVQLQTLTLLNERPTATVSELAKELEVDPSAVARHLSELHEAALVEIAEGSAGEGSAEPRYRALARALWSDEEWALFGQEEQKRLTRWIIEMIDSDAKEANEAGTFTARRNSHASRTVPMVDEQGWEELCRIHADTLEAVFAVEAASAERLAERGEAGFPALSALICCELPPRGSAAKGDEPRG